MSSPIYLDYAASTPTDPAVADAMHQHLCLGGNFANPASRGHVYGWQADEAVESARASTAQMLNADPREIVWTSGATESDNLAIKGLLSRGLRTGRKHIVTSAIEHKAILDTCAWMEDQGFSVSYLQPSASGAITPAQSRGPFGRRKPARSPCGSSIVEGCAGLLRLGGGTSSK